MTIPCKDCICLAICRPYVLSDMGDTKPGKKGNVINVRVRILLKKCSIIKDFIYSDGKTYQHTNKEGIMKTYNLLNISKFDSVISYYLKEPYKSHIGSPVPYTYIPL